MARKKLSEFTAKSLLFTKLGMPYTGIPVTAATVADKKFSQEKTYVVKVDQGVKGRMKKGLVALNVTADNVSGTVIELAKSGYTNFLIEEFLPHASNQERYFSLEQTRHGIVVYYSDKGGIDIESNQQSVQKILITNDNTEQIASYLGLPKEIYIQILELFTELYISFLEVNPLVVMENNYYFLDLAVEVDSTAAFFVKHGWIESDLIVDSGIAIKTDEEREIINLKAKSASAFMLDVLNPNGAIWMLLSGGGGSITIADEVYNQGFGRDIANYGEYSGNPNQEETYIYTKNVLRLLLKSTAPKKVLIIGGGVANFTDISITFKGVIAAMEEVKEQLFAQNVKVYVRRGGPNQQRGLAQMQDFLQTAGLFGEVAGPEMTITHVALAALENLK